MSDSYTFNLVRYESNEAVDPREFTKRPFIRAKRTFEQDAKRFIPGDQLETAINTAIAIGEPLLLTGEPGTGKTQAAYYTAYKLGINSVIHFQVKSDSVARDLLYFFDAVRYFYDAQLLSRSSTPDSDQLPKLDKWKYIEKRPLWQAFELAKESGRPQILLIDEIDKAPRDFPNDLLYELDQMKFNIIEIENSSPIDAPDSLRPIVFITSNSERRLPEPFLRRCVYHHIQFDEELIKKIVNNRMQDFPNLSPEFLDLAIQSFFELRNSNLRKPPATSECLVWFNVLSLAQETDVAALENGSELPYLGVLLKDRHDLDEIRSRRR